MRRTLNLSLSLLAVVALTGCATLRVGSDYDREVSFETRETYDWAEFEDEEGEVEADADALNPFLDRRLRRAIDAELEARGYRVDEEGDVDMLVAVSVVQPEQAATAESSFAFPLIFGLSFGYGPGFYWPSYGYGYGYGYGRYGWGSRFGRYGYYRPYFGAPYGYSSFRAFPYYGYAGGHRGGPERLAPGSFVIDVLDGESGELIWRGWANGALAYAPEVEDLPEFISSVVHDVLEAFPPDAP